MFSRTRVKCLTAYIFYTFYLREHFYSLLAADVLLFLCSSLFVLSKNFQYKFLWAVAFTEYSDMFMLIKTVSWYFTVK